MQRLSDYMPQALNKTMGSFHRRSNCMSWLLIQEIAHSKTCLMGACKLTPAPTIGGSLTSTGAVSSRLFHSSLKWYAFNFTWEEEGSSPEGAAFSAMASSPSGLLRERETYNIYIYVYQGEREIYIYIWHLWPSSPPLGILELSYTYKPFAQAAVVKAHVAHICKTELTSGEKVNDHCTKAWGEKSEVRT